MRCARRLRGRIIATTATTTTTTSTTTTTTSQQHNKVTCPSSSTTGLQEDQDEGDALVVRLFLFVVLALHKNRPVHS
jgi:hypothetical protein